MPKINPYLIPKETQIKTEEVRYLNTEIPSYEEFMKTYEPSDFVETIIEAEWQDRLLNGPQFGPGNANSKDNFKTAMRIGISTAAPVLILASGGAAAPFVIGGAAAWGGGKVVKKVGKELDCEVLEWVGSTVEDIGFGTTTGAVAGAFGGMSGASSLASHIARDGTRSGVAIGAAMKTTKYSYDLYEGSKEYAELEARKDHRKHQERGINYDSNCPVCTNSWPCN